MAMTKCPYPDCTGQVAATDEFCGECGRSLDPIVVRAAQGESIPVTLPPMLPETPPVGAGATSEWSYHAAIVPTVADDDPALTPSVPPAPGLAPPPPESAIYGPSSPTPPPAYKAMPLAPPPYGALPPAPPPVYQVPPPPSYGAPQTTTVLPTAPPARRGANPLLIVGGLVGGLVLLMTVCCVGSVLVAPSSPTPTPTPTLVRINVQFDLSELSASNDFTVSKDLRSVNERARGTASLNANYSYSKQGSPELINTVKVMLNNNVVIELAANNDPLFATTNPKVEVAVAGKSYKMVSPDVTITVDKLTLDSSPVLGDGTTGKYPVFTSLVLTLRTDVRTDGVDPTP